MATFSSVHDITDHTGIPGVGAGGSSEMAYAQITSPVTVTATVEASADTIVTAGAFTADGSSAYHIEFFAPYVNAAATSGASIRLWLFQDGSSIGSFGLHMAEAAGNNFDGWYSARRMIPSSGSRTYSVRATLGASGSGSVGAGAGGAGNYLPAFIRITVA